jgi:hypothetical protein
MTNDVYQQLRDHFRKVFEAKWDRSELANYDELRERFAWHMADVATNLTALARFYENPDSCDTKCLSERTELFFSDCVPHLIAAAQIYDEVPQIFEEQRGVHDWNSFTDDEGDGAQGSGSTVDARNARIPSTVPPIGQHADFATANE